MKYLPFLLLSLIFVTACNTNVNEIESEQSGPALVIVDSKLEEQEIFAANNVVGIREYLQIYPDTAQTDTSFLIRYTIIDSLGRELKSAEYRIDGMMLQNTATQYDESGKRITSETIGSTGVTRGTAFYTYDEWGRPAEVVRYIGPDQSSPVFMRVSYLPDERQVHQNLYTEDSTLISNLRYKVNEEGRFEESNFSRNDQEFSQYFQYNEQGWLIEDLLVSDGRVYARTYYQYNDAGLKTYKWLIGVGDSLEGIVEYQYDYQ